MEKIFLISGLGADEKLFRKLDLSGYEVIGLSWLEPSNSDTLTTYAAKLINAFRIEAGSIVIGVSLGGMLAVEIDKQVKLKHCIIISSIKTIAEAPGYFKFFKAFPVYKLIPAKWLISLGFLAKPLFYSKIGADSYLFNLMLQNTSPVFMKWAMHAALNWKGEEPGQHIHHIAGDADMIFNYRRIKNASLIKGGDHMMVFAKAKEISPMIRNILNQ